MRRNVPAQLARWAAYYREQGQPERAEQLEARLLAEARCKRCGRELSDEVSIRRGVGPDCWAREQ